MRNPSLPSTILGSLAAASCVSIGLSAMWCRCLPVKDAARRLQDSRRPADRSGPKPREYSTGVTAATRAAAVYLALGGHPVGAHAHLHFERRVHLVGAAHGVAQQGHALLDLGLGALEDELVMHLEDELVYTSDA